MSFETIPIRIFLHLLAVILAENDRIGTHPTHVLRIGHDPYQQTFEINDNKFLVK
jgi:hypothetical protein